MHQCIAIHKMVQYAYWYCKLSIEQCIADFKMTSSLKMIREKSLVYQLIVTFWIILENFYCNTKFKEPWSPHYCCICITMLNGLPLLHPFILHFLALSHFYSCIFLTCMILLCSLLLHHLAPYCIVLPCYCIILSRHCIVLSHHVGSRTTVSSIFRSGVTVTRGGVTVARGDNKNYSISQWKMSKATNAGNHGDHNIVEIYQ